MKFGTILLMVLTVGTLGLPAIGDDAADLVREFQETKTKAEAGDINAQYKLGGMYGKGAGTAKDDAAAVVWYRKVAEQNDPRGQSMLGVMYTNARGVERDYDAAMTWFRKAAAQNSAHAMYNLGHMYSTGKGVTKDDVESAAWYRKASELYETNSQRILGSLYSLGRGVPKDIVQAYAWTKVAVDAGDAAALPQLQKLETAMSAEQKSAGNEAAKTITAKLPPRKKP